VRDAGDDTASHVRLLELPTSHVLGLVTFGESEALVRTIVLT
jgi:hypothetical protein